jgi:hypothetical protein
MLGKSDKIQRRVVRVSTNAEMMELFREWEDLISNFLLW